METREAVTSRADIGQTPRSPIPLHTSEGLGARRWLGRMCLWLALFPAASPVQSEEWVVRVPLADRSEAAVDSAAREALSQLLRLNTGDPDIPMHPDVAPAIQDARNRLSLYRFEVVENQTVLVAQFDSTMVEGLIRAADGSYWAEPRPPILLWLVIDDLEGRRFGNLPVDQPLWDALEVSFEALGVNLRRPLYDLVDSVRVSPDTLWRRDLGPVIEASERYGMNHLLIGRLVRLSEGRTIAEWRYFDPDTEQMERVQSSDLADLIDPAVVMTLSVMRGRYAVRLQAVAPETSLTITVRNVTSLEDYRAVNARIATIQTLEHFRVTGVVGAELTIELFGIPDLETLKKLLGVELGFRWAEEEGASQSTAMLDWSGQ